MNPESLIELQTRLRRVERQNRALIVLLCVAAGLASLAATKSAGNVIRADEVIARRLTLVDEHGRVVDWQEGRNGVRYTQ